jgi:hypothetical protein
MSNEEKALILYKDVLSLINGYSNEELLEIENGSTYTDDPLYCTILIRLNTWDNIV